MKCQCKIWVWMILLWGISGTLLNAAQPASSTESSRFNDWHIAAQLANASYQPDTGPQQISKALALQIEQMETLPESTLYYYLAKSSQTKTYTIVVRGTANIDNVWLDVRFKLMPNTQLGISLHEGFSKAAHRIYQRIESTLDKTYRINMTGHSLGGAVALILAMYLDNNDYQVGHVVTFGQPKVTNLSGAKQYSHLDVTRIVTDTDIVPLIPPADVWDLTKLDIYWHLGTEVVLFPGRYYAQLTGLNSMLRGITFLTKMPDKTHLQGHRMTLYLNRIEEKINNQQLIPFADRTKYLNTSPPAIIPLSLKNDATR